MQEYGFSLTRIFCRNHRFCPPTGKHVSEKTCIMTFYMQQIRLSNAPLEVHDH